MDTTTTTMSALFVLDGSTGAADVAAAASRLVGHDASWTVISMAPEHPAITSGATGFAGPVLTIEEMESQASEDGAQAAAAAQGVSMLALGSHDRGWFARLLRPSVSDAVRERAVRPVLILR